MPGAFGGADDFGRAPQQCRRRHGIVGGERHERGIGAVLQEAPHQIGQEIAVTADRRIGPVGHVREILAQLRVERLAHAVQPLKLKSPFATGQFQNGRDRQRIVRGKLREQAGS